MKTVTPSVSGHPIVYRPIAHHTHWLLGIGITLAGAIALAILLAWLACALANSRRRSMEAKGLISSVNPPFTDKNGGADSGKDRAANLESQ